MRESEKRVRRKNKISYLSWYSTGESSMLRCGPTVGFSFVDAWFMSNHRWRWGVLGVWSCCTRLFAFGLTAIFALFSLILNRFFFFPDNLATFAQALVLSVLVWLAVGYLLFLDVFLIITDISLVFSKLYQNSATSSKCLIFFFPFLKSRVSEKLLIYTCAIIRLWKKKQ